MSVVSKRAQTKSWSRLSQLIFRPIEVELLLGDQSKPQARLGW